MPTYYISGQTYTLASALRAALEALSLGDEEFVSCTVVHPLDEHLEIEAPNLTTVRNALLHVKDQIRDVRNDMARGALRR